MVGNHGFLVIWLQTTCITHVMVDIAFDIHEIKFARTTSMTINVLYTEVISRKYWKVIRFHWSKYVAHNKHLEFL